MATFAHIRSKPALLIMLCLIALLALPFAAADDDDDMDDMMEDAAFVSIRQYDGVNPDDVPRIMSVTGEGFLPIINQVEGFIGYFLMSQADMVAAVTIFDTAENATASNAAARDFVAENLTGLLPNAPIINEGVVSIWHMTPLADTDADMEHESDDDAAGHDEDSTMSDVVGELHGGLRVYGGFRCRQCRASHRNHRVRLLAHPARGGRLLRLSGNVQRGRRAGCAELVRQCR